VLKRTFDFVCAALGLAILSPLFLGVAAAIKLTSRGPVYFRQQRMGINFTPFKIFKFRTMEKNDATDSLITVRGDQRVTPFGRFLRDTKIDELPQLINVLKGEMSLVGPRPEVPEYVEKFHSDYEEILRVRPGMTDEASVLYRNEEDILAQAGDPQTAYVNEVLPKKIGLAKAYLRKHSFLYDLSLIARTLARL